MKENIKNILQLLLLVLPLWGIMVFGWFHSPMYLEAIEKNRLAAQRYLTETYWYAPYVAEERQALMEHYGLNEKGELLEAEK